MQNYHCWVIHHLKINKKKVVKNKIIKRTLRNYGHFSFQFTFIIKGIIPRMKSPLAKELLKQCCQGASVSLISHFSSVVALSC